MAFNANPQIASEPKFVGMLGMVYIFTPCKPFVSPGLTEFYYIRQYIRKHEILYKSSPWWMVALVVRLYLRKENYRAGRTHWKRIRYTEFRLSSYTCPTTYMICVTLIGHLQCFRQSLEIPLT